MRIRLHLRIATARQNDSQVRRHQDGRLLVFFRVKEMEGLMLTTALSASLGRIPPEYTNPLQLLSYFVSQPALWLTRGTVI